MSTACTENRKEADLIIYNAKIYTVDKYFSTSQAMAVSKGIILETGTDIDIMRKYNSENMINAGTKPIYPGFIDAHSHFTGYATGFIT